MTLREYLQGLNYFVKQNPWALDKPVIYASDDEGNDRHQVLFTPCGMQVDDPEGQSIEIIKEYKGDNVDMSKNEWCTKEEVNAICIN